MRRGGVLLAALLLAAAALPRQAAAARSLSLFGIGGDKEEEPVVDPNYIRPINTYNPMCAKTAYALQFLLPTPTPEAALVPGATLQMPLAGGTVDLYQPLPQDLVVVFRAGESLAIAANSSTGGKQIPFLQPFVYTSTAPAQLVDAFSELLSNATGGAAGEGPLADAVEPVSASTGGGPQLLRVVCMGEGPGSGGLAVLCGTWAALRYPLANTVVITFASPWTAAFNAPFAWSFQQLVTLHYLWPFSSTSLLVNATVAKPTVLQMADAVNPFINEASVAAAIEVPGVPSPVPPTSEKWEPGDDLGELAPALNLAPEYEMPDSDCPTIICKTRPALALSCLGFGKGTEQYNLDVYKGLPYITLTDVETNGDASVAWNETRSTLYLLFKYTEEREDWLVDAQAYTTNDFPADIEPQSPAPPGDRLSDVITNVRVHSGFHKQFKGLAIDLLPPELTGGDPRPLTMLTQAIYNLTGDKDPLRIVVSGFSLGGALSELGGVWAAQLWPAADVMVANQGAPIVGDDEFVRLAQATYGRGFKYVYRFDQVPSIPPLPGYTSTHSSIWIMEDSVMLQDRPYLGLTETTWDDHTCDIWTDPDNGNVIVGYVPQLFNATRVSVPAWVYTAGTPAP